MPSIAVSGLAFYTGDKLPKWKGDVFVGGLRTGEIIGTGQIQRVLSNDKFEELRREALLTDWRQRMRDVRQGPDGLLYVLVDDDDGAILRIEPATKSQKNMDKFLPTGVLICCCVLFRRPSIASNESAWHGALCS